MTYALTKDEQDQARYLIKNEHQQTAQRKFLAMMPFISGFSKSKLNYLSQLCFTHEYVFYESENETIIIDELEQDLLAGKYKKPKQLEIKILLYSCYRPLYKSPVEEIAVNLEQSLASPIFSNIIKMQIYDFREDEAAKANIQTFGTLSNKVSIAVRGMYEDNPYPRLIREDDSLFDDVPDPKPIDVLVAGCATGTQIYNVKNNFPNADIDAFDLSLASLAFAKRHTKSRGLKQVKFYHGDILNLKELNKTYDVIVCSGVLHHMKDPVAGWRALLDALNPNGTMYISLYSSYARQVVRSIKEMFIQDRPFSPEYARQLRQKIMAQPLDGPISVALSARDFFFMSELRDFLFHVQEHTYNLPEIKYIINELGMEFTGFTNKGNELEGFKKLYPDEKDLINMDLWDNYEQDNPLTFLGMYHFSCKRK